MLWKLWPLGSGAPPPLREDGSGQEDASVSSSPVYPGARVSGVMEQFKHRFHRRCPGPHHPEGCPSEVAHGRKGGLGVRNMAEGGPTTGAGIGHQGLKGWREMSVLR